MIAVICLDKESEYLTFGEKYYIEFDKHKLIRILNDNGRECYYREEYYTKNNFITVEDAREEKLKQLLKE